ncbi:MAG: site-2 protease family protein [Pirellulales bacterium]
MVPASPQKDFGFALTLGPITAFRKDAVGEKAGLKVGDLITQIDGAPVGDPLKLEKAIRAKAGQSVKLTVERKSDKASDGKPETLTIDVAPQPLDYEEHVTFKLPISSLGIACDVLPVVSAVTPGGPADTAGIKVGQTIESVQVMEPKEPAEGQLFPHASGVIPLGGGAKAKPSDPQWGNIFHQFQDLDPTSKIKFTVHDGEKTSSFEFFPVTSTTDFNVDRGLIFDGDSVKVKYHFGEAVVEALKTTGDKLTMVVGMLKKLFGGGISVKNLGGPVMIASQAGAAANAGFSELLLFLVMLSANLAVINMLPIPALDGGHFVFLLYEGITGKPMNAKVFEILMSIGVLLLLTLMLFVLGLDFGLISRR